MSKVGVTDIDTHIRMPRALYQWIARKADEEERTTSNLVVCLLGEARGVRIRARQREVRVAYWKKWRRRQRLLCVFCRHDDCSGHFQYVGR